LAHNKPHTEEAKKKISENNLGKKDSKKTKKLKSKRKKGKNNPMFGAVLTAENKAKKAAAMKDKNKGEDNPLAKLTNIQRDEIKYKFKEFGFSIFILSVQYNVTERTIERITQPLR
jgi:hypothetical protein